MSIFLIQIYITRYNHINHIHTGYGHGLSRFKSSVITRQHTHQIPLISIGGYGFADFGLLQLQVDNISKWLVNDMTILKTYDYYSKLVVVWIEIIRWNLILYMLFYHLRIDFWKIKNHCLYDSVLLYQWLKV